MEKENYLEKIKKQINNYLNGSINLDILINNSIALFDYYCSEFKKEDETLVSFKENFHNIWDNLEIIYSTKTENQYLEDIKQSLLPKLIKTINYEIKRNKF